MGGDIAVHDAPPTEVAVRAAFPSMPPDFKIAVGDVREQFVRGGGKGGQCVNRLANCVMLKHLPTGIEVREHSSRSLERNRKLAHDRLFEKVAHELFGVKRKVDIHK
eukprot:Opistho-2@582